MLGAWAYLESVLSEELLNHHVATPDTNNQLPVPHSDPYFSAPECVGPLSESDILDLLLDLLLRLRFRLWLLGWGLPSHFFWFRGSLFLLFLDWWGRVS